MAGHPFLDELPLHALGALAPEESRRLGLHLVEGCELCERELASLEDAAQRLAYSIPGAEAPPELKGRLLARVANASPVADTRAQVLESTRFRRSPTQLLLLAASLILVAGLGTLWLLARRDVAVLQAQREELTRSLSDQRRSLEEKLAVQAKEVVWLHDPRVQVALLKGLESTSLARARLLFNPATRQGLLYVEGLPPLPLEKSYALWAFVKDTPVPAGVFETTTGSAVLPLSQQGALADGPSKFAVSIEPHGGGPTPTGTIVLLGGLSF
ncbi:MAG: anti-sigma factor [Thermoanaerobaculia bacterium]